MEEFEHILQTLKNLLSHLGIRFTRRKQRASHLGLPKFTGFQVPLKGAFYSSGNFDPSGKGSVGRPHNGVDLRQSGGSSIYPIAAGRVTQVYEDPKGGHAVVIQHANGFGSYYAHLGTVMVHPGEIALLSTIIGTVGASGNATKRDAQGQESGVAHLHLEVRHNGSLVDPASVISVPSYTAFNPVKERSWLPGAKEQAASWQMQSHLQG